MVRGEVHVALDQGRLASFFCNSLPKHLLDLQVSHAYPEWIPTLLMYANVVFCGFVFCVCCFRCSLVL